MSEQYARAEVGDGLAVLTEQMPGVRSVALGVWVKTGSVHEEPEEMGVSHLLEHMVFKGTQRRSAHEIALVLERLGGSLDAYTTREHTCYQARVLDEHLDIALEVLADLVVSPLLRATDLELEREVVLEEISTVEDTPDDLIFDLHSRALWGEHPYGYSILGTRESVTALSDEALRRKHERTYRQPNLMIAAAGSVQHNDFVNRVIELFSAAGSGGGLPAPAQPTNGARMFEHVQRQTAQTHIVFGSQVFGHGDPRRYALVMLSNAFGGGMSSRLFQKVREELGLAYAVFSFQSFHQLAGSTGVYVGTRHEWADRATDVIRQEYARLARDGLTDAELSDIKGQVKGQIVLALESSSSRLQRLAGTALYDEEFLSLSEVMRRIDAVTLNDVAALAAEFYDPDRQTVVRLGPG
ncbi:MAG TPA: pitrilysin family protein [Longimicrobiales bacterium]|nr:pitrilysin family protein [Longimicrobiales bacterium]